MNTCLFCENEIPAKTKAGKPRKFCNKSCSRKYVCANKPEVVKAANKKGYETTVSLHGEDFLKHRGRSTKEKRNSAKKLHEQGHFHNMSNIGNATRKKKGNSPEQIEKWRKSYEENGHMLSDPNWKQYSRKCRRLTAKLYGSAGEGFHWDHIVPLIVGFKENIPPEMICSKINIQRLTAEENFAKGHSLTEHALEVLESMISDQNPSNVTFGDGY